MFYVLIYNKGSSNTNISVNYKTNKHQTTDKADKQNEIISAPFFSSFFIFNRNTSTVVITVVTFFF